MKRKDNNTNTNSTGWDKLTLSQFYDIQDAVYDIDDPIEQQIRLLSIVNDIPEEELLSYPLSQLRELNHTIAFINRSPSPAPLQYDYTINGTTYCFTPNLADLTVAQYVDYQNYLKEIEKEKKSLRQEKSLERKKVAEAQANNSTSELSDTQTQDSEGEANAGEANAGEENAKCEIHRSESDFLNIPFRLSRLFPQMLSVFLIPKNHKYGDGYDMQKCASDILQMPVTRLLSVSVFFLILYLSCENAMISLARTELRKSKKANF